MPKAPRPWKLDAPSNMLDIAVARPTFQAALAGRGSVGQRRMATTSEGITDSPGVLGMGCSSVEWRLLGDEERSTSGAGWDVTMILMTDPEEDGNPECVAEPQDLPAASRRMSSDARPPMVQ